MTDDTKIDVTPDDERPLSTNPSPMPKVRPAGPDGQPDLPKKQRRDWDEVDQATDESFPASDPPGQGVG